MMSKKGKIIFLLVSAIVLVIGVVGWQVYQLYAQSETSEKANLVTPKQKKSKKETDPIPEINDSETEQATEKQIEAAVQTQKMKEKNEKEKLEQTVISFTKAFLTYSTDSVSSDFKKASPYMTKFAQSANEPNTDEKYESNKGIYKQAAGDTEVYLQVPIIGNEASFITIAECHSESEGGVSTNFPLLLRGELEKQKDGTWLISQVTIGNPANFPEQFFNK
ncbi:hypothetical protein [Listeria farberi]|uniref:Uncharacterized protein n=1 Tax=Listeria farberi TaxID=2713500 RepID=A0A7X1DFJ5_9LIST|nr:hypothetical protein [Listeria farberi]MBC2288828.1 hypothetical protein [Listeria farberi]